MVALHNLSTPRNANVFEKVQSRKREIDSDKMIHLYAAFDSQWVLEFRQSWSPVPAISEKITKALRLQLDGYF